MSRPGATAGETAAPAPAVVAATEADESLRLEGGHRLEHIARQVPGMLYMYELKRGQGGRLRYATERGAELFGLPTGEALRNMGAVWDMVPAEDRARMKAALDVSARTLGEWRCEFRVRRPDGEWRWMMGTASPERRSAETTRWYGYVEDITQRVQLEQARRDAASAEAANRAKTEFLSRMSHELRTPLNAVLGFAQLMEIDRIEPPGAGQQRRLKLIREAGEHLLHMITDLLDLTRVESGGLALVMEPIALRSFAEQSVELMRSAAATAQVTLSLGAGGEGLVVQADRTRLRQVLLNLLSNAIKYNRVGGKVVVQVSLHAAPVDGHEGSPMAVLSVDDTGVGIAESDLAEVFEPFHRGRHAAGSIEGTGIGLSVTRALVGLMGGRVEVKSQPDIGSSFSAILPLSTT